MKLEEMRLYMDSIIIKEIQQLTKKIKAENELIDREVIRDDVFNILQKIPNCIVVYYPIETEASEDGCDGCHIVRNVKDKEIQLVFINTANARERQAFSVAHELGHIWNVDGQLRESIPGSNFDIEDVINRFAAELLMPETIFKREALRRINKIKSTDNVIKMYDFIKIIVYLMNYFFAPYKSVVLRLNEVKIIDTEGVNALLKHKDSDYVKTIMNEEQYTRLGIVTNQKSIAKLADKLEEIEKKEIFTNNKIENIRKIFDLTKMPQDIEIREEVKVDIP